MEKTIKERYQAIQENVQDFRDDTSCLTVDDVLEMIIETLELDVLSYPVMERFARQLANAAYDGTMIRAERYRPLDNGFSHLGDPRCVCDSDEIAASRDVQECCIGEPVSDEGDGQGRDND